jgi:ADP-heptose:LPS heptosyltransferase
VTPRSTRDERIISAKKSRLGRVQLAVRKFGLLPEQVEAALDRIDVRFANSPQRVLIATLGNKTARDRCEGFINSAERTLSKARGKELPEAVKGFIEYTELVDKLELVIAMSKSITKTKQQPSRTDGYERRIAAEEACSLLLGRRWSLKNWHELAAILYGTADPADVRRACRSLREHAKQQLVDGSAGGKSGGK